MRLLSLKVTCRTVPALIGIDVPNLARKCSRRTGVTPRYIDNALCRRISPSGAVLARRMVRCPNSTAELTFVAQYALCLVRVGVLARAARSAIGAGGSAHLSSAAVNADPRADVSRHLCPCPADCAHSTAIRSVCIFSWIAIAAGRRFGLRIERISWAVLAITGLIVSRACGKCPRRTIVTPLLGLHARCCRIRSRRTVCAR